MRLGGERKRLHLVQLIIQHHHLVVVRTVNQQSVLPAPHYLKDGPHELELDLLSSPKLEGGRSFHLSLRLHINSIIEAIKMSTNLRTIPDSLHVDATCHEAGVVLVVDALEGDQLAAIGGNVEVIIAIHPIHGQEHDVLAGCQANWHIQIFGSNGSGDYLSGDIVVVLAVDEQSELWNAVPERRILVVVGVGDLYLGLLCVQVGWLIELSSIELRGHDVALEHLTSDAEGVCGEESGTMTGLDGAGIVVIVHLTHQEVVGE